MNQIYIPPLSSLKSSDTRPPPSLTILSEKKITDVYEESVRKCVKFEIGDSVALLFCAKNLACKFAIESKDLGE
jgi:hypothetical protein